MIYHGLAIALLTLLSAFCSCSEVAFFSLSSSRIKSYRSSRDPSKRRVARLLKRSTSLLVTIFMINTIVNVLLQNVSSDLFEQFGGWILKVGLPLVLILTFGELLPKYIGLLHNEPLAVASAPSLEILQKITTPFRLVITEGSNFLSRLLFFFLKAGKPPTSEELRHILQNQSGKGLLHQDEAELIFGVLSLEGKQAKEIMLPYSSMPSFDIH
ncbi:MAG: DUF21 domain-containing protein, partial [Verrucomicrobia bacterium]|nr:DUF21 domain-containing protein [Verrucomicrobiota bacterium]